LSCKYCVAQSHVHPVCWLWDLPPACIVSVTDVATHDVDVGTYVLGDASQFPSVWLVAHNLAASSPPPRLCPILPQPQHTLIPPSNSKSPNTHPTLASKMVASNMFLGTAATLIASSTAFVAP
ncbi:unnamed protein product, partial [Ectocarpus fasciculatus]